MAVNPSPFGPKPAFFDAAGAPDNTYKLFTYIAGSNTKQNTYTSSTGSVANSNPIILNTLGMTPNEFWFTASALYKVVLAPSTDTDPPSSPIWTIDNLRGINDPVATVTQDEWVQYGAAATYVSATSFTVAGNATTTFQIGRRIKTTNSGGAIYSTITNSVFGAVTTLTVTNDSGTLDSGLSIVSYGLLAAINPSVPATYAKSGAVTASGLTQSTARVLGRITAGTGAVEELTAAQVATFANGVPAGTIIDFAGTTAPTGFLACPTTATNISRTTYATLFAAISTTWGAGDGSTTFGCPWFTADYAAVQANANVGTNTVGQNLAHTHAMDADGRAVAKRVGSDSFDAKSVSAQADDFNYGGDQNTGSTGGAANLAAGHRVLKCVKL